MLNNIKFIFLHLLFCLFLFTGINITAADNSQTIPYVTSSDKNLSKEVDHIPSTDYTIPARSVVTFVGTYS